MALGSTVVVPKYGNGTYSLNTSNYPLTAGEVQTLYFDINQNQHHDSFVDMLLKNLRSGTTIFRLHMVVMTEGTQWQGEVAWPGPCALSEEIGAKLVASQCTVPGGNRDIVVDGVTHNRTNNAAVRTDSADRASTMIDENNKAISSERLEISTVKDGINNNRDNLKADHQMAGNTYSAEHDKAQKTQDSLLPRFSEIREDTKKHSANLKDEDGDK